MGVNEAIKMHDASLDGDVRGEIVEQPIEQGLKPKTLIFVT